MKIKWKIVLTSVVVILMLSIGVTGFTYFEVNKLIKTENHRELENYSNMGLQIIDKSYPGNWKIEDGVLYKGAYSINENYDLIDQFTNGTDVLATLFLNDTRVSTNIIDENKNRQINTQASEVVIETVLKQGKEYLGTADILGKSAQTYYVPIKDENGSVIGMWFVGLYTDVATKSVYQTMYWIAILAVIMLAIGIIVSIFLGRTISNGITMVKLRLKEMENGSFNFEFNEALLKRKDEIGEIANSSNNMQMRLGKIISGIQEEAENVKDTTIQSLNSIEEINLNIEEICATTEQLSAGMQETSASTQEMNASTYEIETEVSTMKEKTYQGETLAKEIKARAQKLKEETIISKTNTENIYDKTNKQLRESINKTAAIEEIKELAQTILSITSQTNLLALNAAIEAARAGEAGKGFAVVADEIRILAENSKNAVSSIHDITHNVSDAVKGVVEDSQLLLEFVDSQVKNDYEMFVKTSIQYDQDADTVQSVVMDINNSTEQLYETIQEIRTAIDEVTTATGEGASGTSEIASKISEIAQKMNVVLKQAQENQSSAKKLDEMIEFFQLK